MERSAVPSDYVALGGQLTTGEDAWTCVAVDGEVGTLAAWIELTDADAATRRPVVARTGAVVVCLPSTGTIRVLTADGAQLGKHVVRTT